MTGVNGIAPVAAATSSAGGDTPRNSPSRRDGEEQVVLDDPVLAYDEEVGEEDIKRVGGQLGSDKTMLAEAKRHRIEGLVAVPLIELKQGKPDQIAWTLVGVKEKGGAIYKDNYLKWSGPAKTLFEGAPEEALIRLDVDLRNVKW